MKTLKEIHESQGEKFGYRLICKHHFSTFKAIGYDSDDDNFFLRNKMTGDIIQECSASTLFTLIQEPQEIYENTHRGIWPTRSKLREAADELERYKAALAKCKEQRDESVMLHEHLETRREKYVEINKYEAVIEAILAEYQPTEASQVGIGSHGDKE